VVEPAAMFVPWPVRGFHGDGGDRDHAATREGVAHVPVERAVVQWRLPLRGEGTLPAARSDSPSGSRFPSRPSLVRGTPCEREVRPHGSPRCPALGRHDLEYEISCSMIDRASGHMRNRSDSARRRDGPQVYVNSTETGSSPGS